MERTIARACTPHGGRDRFDTDSVSGPSTLNPQPSTRPRPRRRYVLLIAALLAVVAAARPALASVFGEDNVTLVRILAELSNARAELEDLNAAAHVTAGLMRDVRDTYAHVNAGIDELGGYSWGRFVDDFQDDLYRQYPAFGELAHGSSQLGRWDATRTRSPFTAYEAITAVVGDVGAALSDDVAAGRANVDEALIMKGEAAGGFAAAATAEEATRAFDAEVQALALLAQDASPGQAAQLAARTQLLVAAQNSYLIRLVSRTVRLDGVDLALAYSRRLRGQNQLAAATPGLLEFALDAATPTSMVSFEGIF